MWCSRGRRLRALRWFFPLPAAGLVASGAAFGRAVTNTLLTLISLFSLISSIAQNSIRSSSLPRPVPVPSVAARDYADEFLCVFVAPEFGVPESG